MCHGEVVLLDALEKVGTDVFYSCPEIKAIWVRNSSVADSLRGDSSCDYVAILPARSTMVGDGLLWDLRRQKDAVIPEGVREIGAQWFQNTEVENVTIPKSVEEVGSDVFRNCENLNKICVEDGCKASFVNTGVPYQTSVITLSTTLVGSMSIYDLRQMKDVVIPEGVKKIGNYWFWRSKI